MPDNATPETTPTHEAADLEAFDFDGFIAGIVEPSTLVRVAKDRTLGQQIKEADQAITDLQRQEELAKATGSTSKRRAASAHSPAMENARTELAQLEERARGTWLFVRVKALTKKVRQGAVEYGTAADRVQDEQNRYNMWALHVLARVFDAHPDEHPDTPGREFTPEQWDAFTDAIGVVQSDALIEAMAEVSAAGVSPDFSQPASPSPDGDTSAKS